MTTATGIDFTEMRVSKVVGFRMAEDDVFEYIVLDGVHGDRHLVIGTGHQEAFPLAASLGGIEWGRPMTYQFMAALVQSLGGRVRQVRIDRLVEGAYAATVEVEGPLGVAPVDARSSDALNLAVLAGAPVFVASEVLEDCESRQRGDSAEAGFLRSALSAGPMTIMRSEA
jgi:bifunctional DNase/RNase